MRSPLHIEEIEPEHLAEVVYLAAASSGGADTEVLTLQRARVTGLPSSQDGLQGLLVASDLQGIVTDWAAGGVPVLLGEHLAEVYVALADAGKVPCPSQVGVLLAGDLFSAPDAGKRGASGDVRPVWSAFGRDFRWVVGVQGNHDELGSAKERQRLFGRGNLHLLDGERVTLDGLTLGGVGLVTGNPAKPGRRSEEAFLGLLDRVIAERADVVILHEGPDGGRGQRGNPQISARLERARVGLTVCGHTPWPTPLQTADSGAQTLNVDGRALLLLPA